MKAWLPLYNACNQFDKNLAHLTLLHSEEYKNIFESAWYLVFYCRLIVTARLWLMRIGGDICDADGCLFRVSTLENGKS